jgi:type IX secretion system PorP/SprF family membrane protein
MRRVVGIVMMGIITIVKLNAQQTPVYSQYMLNKFLTNPAIAGSEGYSAINITAREQWLGFKDAPRTHSISYQTRVDRRSFLNKIQIVRRKTRRPASISNVGLGVYLYNDNRGLLNQTGLQLTYAYHIELDEIQLSFGLTTSFTQFKVSVDKLKLAEEGDELLYNNKLNSLNPDVNFGVYVTSPDYYAGVSVSDIMQSSVKFNANGLEKYRKLRNYNLSGGYRFKINRDYSIEPGANFKSTEQFNNQLDITVRGYYQNTYWGGLGFRTGGAVYAMAGIKYANFYFGYSYDHTLNALQSNSLGSHEFMVTYKFGRVARKYKWLERF